MTRRAWLPFLGRVRFGLVLASAILLLSACAEQTIKNAQSFSQVASAYQDRLPPLLDTTLEAAVRQSSRQLLRTREALSEEERKAKLKESEALFEGQFQTIETIKKQTGLLRSTFVALGALAGSDAATQISAATKQVMGELDTLSRQAVKLKILQESSFSPQKDKIQAVLASTAEFVVAQVKAAAIRDFLKEYGKTIDTSLAIQEQLLAVIRKQLTFYGEADIERGRSEEVFLPFVTGDGLKVETWTAKRLSFYKRTLNLQNVKSAEEAAKNVRTAFADLAQNRLTVDSIELILVDISRIERIYQALSTATSSSQ